MRSSAARASAIGVERDPGRDHGVGDAAPAPTRRPAWRRTWRCGGRRRRHRHGASARPRLSTGRDAMPQPMARRRDHGPAIVVVLLHGFTQTGACWGAVRRRPGRATTSVVPRRRARPRRLRRRSTPTSPTSADLLGRGRRAGRPTSATRWAAAWPCASRSTDPTWSTGLVLIGATGGHRRPRRARGPPGRRRARSPTASSAIGVDAFLDEWLAQPLFAGLEPEAAAREPSGARNTADGPGVAACASPAPGPGAAVGPAGEPRRARAGGGRRATTPSSRALGRPAGRGHRRQRRRRASSPAPATPPTSSSRRRRVSSAVARADSAR